MARNFLFYYLAHKHRRLICKSLCSNIPVLNTISTFRSIGQLSAFKHFDIEVTYLLFISLFLRYDIWTIVILFWHMNFQRIHIQNGIRFKQTFYIKPLVRLIFPESIQDFGIDYIKFHCWPQIQRAQHP